jgi:hypothetical protein
MSWAGVSDQPTGPEPEALGGQRMGFCACVEFANGLTAADVAVCIWPPRPRPRHQENISHCSCGEYSPHLLRIGFSAGIDLEDEFKVEGRRASDAN